MIRALTFDLDDTLWEVAPIIQRAESILHRWLQRHHPALTTRFSIEDLRQLRLELVREHPELTENLTALRKQSLRRAADLAAADPELVEPAFAVFHRARNQVIFYTDVLPVLERLSQHFPMAVLSNGNADYQRVGLGRFFQFGLSAEQVGAAKPRPALFEAACARFALQPGQVAHIGDDPVSDVRGAREAGLLSIWLDRQGARPPPDPPPHLQIQGLDQLEACLAGRSAYRQGAQTGAR